MALCLTAIFSVACSDDSSGEEYSFERDVQDLKVLRSCVDASSSDACYRLHFRQPIETKNLKQYFVWLDTTVVNTKDRSVSKNAKANPTLTKPFQVKAGSYFDTLDLTSYIKDYLDYDSLQVAIWPEYSDNGATAEIQRIYIHFGDDLAPSIVTLQDSVFSDGAAFDWSRPTDQIDFYKPEQVDGPIAGYNVVIYALNDKEDIRNAKISVIKAGVVDSVGGKLYQRNRQFKTKSGSVWLDTTSSTNPRYLRLAIMDGEGFSEVDSLNRFRLIVKGLASSSNGAASRYTIGITSFDSSGNYSGSTVSAESNHMFITTDKIAPLMGTKLFFVEDSLAPGFARLDSNNRVRIFFSRSIDPIKADHGIKEDSVLVIPSTCQELYCFEDVESYQVDRFMNGEWAQLDEAGGFVADRFVDRYNVSGDTFKIADFGTFMVDTIRWVSPGDTLILRVRSKDSSAYYSRALIDTLFVSTKNNGTLECPDGYLPVYTDTSSFCMERFEHRDSTGAFMTNILHSEAVAACESVSASGFKVQLCKERDWELACLSGGTSPYGVVEENALAASEYLYSNCNVATGDSASAANFESRNYKCASRYGLRDLPGQYQEWVLGRSSDTLELLKGSSYRPYGGLDRESIALCTNRFFPYYTRKNYVKDTTVYVYRTGRIIDTSLVLDTNRILYKTYTQKDFTDEIQFFAVKNPATGSIVGYDYAPAEEYRKGGEAWLKQLAGELEYVPDHTEKVFFLNGTTPYKKVSAFYKNSSISFRCCAYPEASDSK